MSEGPKTKTDEEILRILKESAEKPIPPSGPPMIDQEAVEENKNKEGKVWEK